MAGAPISDLARRTTLPQGGQISFAKMPDGTRLRLGRWEARGRTYRGAVMLLQGRAEFIEKYYETINDFLDRGYAVVTFDWRGQGLSDRGPHGRVIDHLDNFTQRIDDLEYIRQRFFSGKLQGPHFAIAHSMGGHVLLRHLLRFPGAFERYIALAPMVGIAPGPIPDSVLRWITRLAVRWGFGSKYMLTQKAVRDVAEREIAGRRLTRDMARLHDTHEVLEKNPDLHLGGVSFGWMKAVFRSCDILMEQAEQNSQKMPLLVFLAGDEQLVDNDKTRAFSNALPAHECITVDNARHELFKETDEVRRFVFGKMMRFLRTHDI
jgi:lysophospholipase